MIFNINDVTLNKWKSGFKKVPFIYNFIKNNKWIFTYIIKTQICNELAENRDFVWVLTAPKTGTITIVNTLRALDKPVNVEASHNGSKILFKSISKFWQWRGMILDEKVREYCKKYQNKKIKVISCVRDPVAASASYFFFINAGEKWEEAVNKGEMHLSDLIKRFYEEIHEVDQWATWVKEVLNPSVNIDVYQHPFPKEKGYLSISNSDGLDLIIVKTEMMDNVLIKAISSCFHIDRKSKIIKSHITSFRPYAELYKVFIQNIRLSQDHLRKIYDSEYVKHFYSDNEISRFQEQWGAGKSN